MVYLIKNVDLGVTMDKHNHCSCGHHHDEIVEEDLYCDLDPNKICDNCMMCLDTFNTDEKGYVQIPIEKIDKSNLSLDELYKMYGLDDED